MAYLYCCLSADRPGHLRDEMQYIEDQVTSDVVVFRIVDCPVQPLIYSSVGSSDENSALIVSDLLDSCPPQWTGDVKGQPGSEKPVSFENSQVCWYF